MPSLRHPVGPLPASVYWRRRIVVLVALLVLAVLIVWPLLEGGGGKNRAGGGRPTPAQSITPGPSPTGSAITTSPGGTGGSGSGTGGSGGGSGGTGGAGGADSGASGGTGTGTSGDSGGTGSGSGGTGGVSGSSGGEVSLSSGGAGSGSGGSASGSASGGSGGSGGSGSAGGSGTGTGGGTTGGATVPVNTAAVRALPVCTSSQVSLELDSAQNAYQPNQKPVFELTVHNSGSGACRVNLGRPTSVLTVNAAPDNRIWSSGDCPSDRTDKWVGISGGAAVTETFVWDRSRSTPQCSSPAPGGAVPDGTYVVQAALSGVSGSRLTARISFRLES